MKKILTFTLLCVFTLLTFSTQAQTKADLVRCLEMIFELDEMEPAFQQQGFDGNTLYIHRPANRAINQRVKDNSQLFYELSDEDFRYARRPIKFVSDADAKNLGLDISELTIVSFGATPSRINFQVRSYLKENLETMQGIFSFTNNSNEWELTSKDVQSSRR